MSSKIVVLKEKCRCCNACIQICPRDCFTVDVNGHSFFNSTKCHDCGHCISVCPEAAIIHTQLPTEDYETIDYSQIESLLSPDKMFNLLKSMRSTRKFKKKDIPQKILEKIADVVRYSPTGHHAQNVELVVLSSPEMLQQIKAESSKAISYILKKIDSRLNAFLAKLIGKGEKIRRARRSRSRFTRMQQGFQQDIDYLFHGAPAVLIFHANKNTTVPADNCNIAAANVRLLCQAYGLGSCFIGYLIYYSKYNPKINELLGIPKENQIYQVLIIGYPKYTFKTYVSRKPSKVTFV